MALYLDNSDEVLIWGRRRRGERESGKFEVEASFPNSA